MNRIIERLARAILCLSFIILKAQTDNDTVS